MKKKIVLSKCQLPIDLFYWLSSYTDSGGDKDGEYGVISSIDIGVSNKISHTIQQYVRNCELAKESIVEAKYTCALGHNHVSFFAKNGNRYMEAHHLIPLSAQGDFESSLDTKANIICLCPNCHRKLHYGNCVDEDLLKLYNLRKEDLEKSKIKITFGELLKYYK